MIDFPSVFLGTKWSLGRGSHEQENSQIYAHRLRQLQTHEFHGKSC